MGRFFEGADRSQATIPECLDDWIDEENPVRVIDAFVDAVDLRELGFDGLVPEATGRPSYHPSVLLKLYIYGYLNRVQSSRRLEREAQILMRLAAGDQTIGEMVPVLYAAVDERLWPAASLSVLAHLIDLVRRGAVVCDGEPGLASAFRLAA